MTSKMRCTIPVLIFLLLFSFTVSPVSSAFAQEVSTVRINAASFPDEAFRQWVLTNADTNGDQCLDSSEIAAVTSINISQNQTIQSVSGIEYFTALEQLNCSYTNLRELDLSANMHLNNLSAISTCLIALSLPEGFSGMSSGIHSENVIWLDEGESTFDLKNWAPSLRPECVQGSVSLDGSLLKGLVPGEDFYFYYVYDGTTNYNNTMNKIMCYIRVRSTSTKPVSMKPDSTANYPGMPLSVYTAAVSARSLYDLAKRSYYNCAGEFVIDTTSSAAVDGVQVSFEIGSLPTGDYGKLNDLGIDTNFGHLRIRADALRIFFNSSRYSTVVFRIQKSGENKYQLAWSISSKSGEPASSSITLPEGSIQFTTVPEGSLVEKKLQYRFAGGNLSPSTRDCIGNADGSVTISAEKSGAYTLLEKKSSDTGISVNYTLDIINPSYGFADEENSNTLTIGANSGCYLQDIIVNGVSVGPKELLTVAEGDVIRIIFSKIGETVTVDTDSQTLSKAERIIAGVKATTIKASSSRTSKGVRLSWKKSAGYSVDAFQIFRSTKRTTGYGTKPFYTTKTGKATSYTNTKSLVKGRYYYYKIRGVRTINGTKYYTKWSNICYRRA